MSDGSDVEISLVSDVVQAGADDCADYRSSFLVHDGGGDEVAEFATTDFDLRRNGP